MEAIFCTLGVTTVYDLQYWLLHTLNILASSYGSHFLYIRCCYRLLHILNILTPENGSHFLYTRCYYSIQLYNWLLHILNILALSYGSHFLYTGCYYSRRLVSVVTTYTEHNSSRKWKPLFVHQVLLQYMACIIGFYLQ